MGVHVNSRTWQSMRATTWILFKPSTCKCSTGSSDAASHQNHTRPLSLTILSSQSLLQGESFNVLFPFLSCQSVINSWNFILLIWLWLTHSSLFISIKFTSNFIETHLLPAILSQKQPAIPYIGSVFLVPFVKTLQFLVLSINPGLHVCKVLHELLSSYLLMSTSLYAS